MKNLQPNPLLSQWASNTNNRIQVDASTRENGIMYKGPIVSNQLNGMAYDIYSSVIYNQFTGGAYNNALTYNEGQYCTIYWKPTASQQGKFLKCICINKSEEGITAVPPIKGAAITTLNGVDTFNGGELDKNNWTFFEEYPMKTTRFTVPFKSTTQNEMSQYNLLTVDKYIPLSDEEFATAPLTKVIEGSFDCFVSKNTVAAINTAYYTFPLTFKLTYTLQKITDGQGTVKYQGYLINGDALYSSIQINYGAISTGFADSNVFIPLPPAGKGSMQYAWLYYGLPWGLSFGFYTSSDTDVICFNVVSCGLDTLIMEGITNADISIIKNTFISSFGSMHFPVRPYGGSNIIDRVGFVYPKAIGISPSIENKAAAYRGQLSLASISNFITLGFLPIDSDECFYGSLIKYIAGPNFNGNISDYLINISNQFPRILDTPQNAPGAVQEDAIRNLTGDFNSYSPGYQPIAFYQYERGLEGKNTGIFKEYALQTKVLTYLSEGAIWGKLIKVDSSLQVSTTDTNTGEFRPKAIQWDYYLQCF